MTDDSSRAVFLSYASQDAEAALRICEGLRGAGIEVWFDQSELRGGDTWDQKIRHQIRDCTLFMPVISASTQARHEGYFRLEWHLAEQRSHLIARGKPFIVPVAIDPTSDTEALVPDAFLAVQWTRLPAGHPTPDFIQQVKRLLDNFRTSPSGPKPIPNSQGQSARGSPRRRPARLPILAGALIAAAAAVFTLVQLRHGSGSTEPAKPEATATSPQASNPPSNSQSQARQLAERGRALFIKFNSSADDYTAAENLIQQALKQDQGDPEIWAISARLNISFATRGFDRSQERNAAARKQAELALKLAPGLLEATFALAEWQRSNDPDLKTAEETYQGILEKDPDYAPACLSLGSVRLRQDRVPEGLALFERAAKQPEYAALADYYQFLYYFRYAYFADADKAVRASIAVQKATNNLTGLGMLLLCWKGDIDGALQAVASGPSTTRDEHRTVWLTSYLQLCQRKPMEALKTLNRLSDDYIIDNWYAGPKSFLVGRAYAQAGSPEAARAAWEAGLATVDARLKANPTDETLHLVRGEILASLGRKDEALREVQTYTEFNSPNAHYWDSSPLVIFAELGMADEALPLIKSMAQPGHRDRALPLTSALLRLDPVWDKLRGDARFNQLVADVDEEEQASGPPRDWPKDPDLKRVIWILDNTISTKEDHVLAEDLVKGVLAKRPTDGEAVTVMARLQVWFLVRGFDRSQERHVMAKRYAERALTLAPDDPEALGAMGVLLDSEGTELPRAEQLLRRAIQLEPQNPIYRRFLAEAALQNPSDGEGMAIAIAKRNCELFPKDVLVFYDTARVIMMSDATLDQWDKSMDPAIALAPLANLLAYKARTTLWIHGSLPGMKSWLDRPPSSSASSERMFFGKFVYSYLSRDWDYGLAGFNGYPDPWLEDFDFSGPPSYLEGVLLEGQGKQGFAKIQFQQAYDELGREKAREPTRLWAIEPWILLALGRTAEAKASCHVLLEAQSRPFRIRKSTSWIFTGIPFELLIGERPVALQLIKEASVSPDSRQVMRVAFSVDWRMAPFRNDPEIAALIAEPTGPVAKK